MWIQTPLLYVSQEGKLNLYSQFAINLSTQASARENYWYEAQDF